MPEAPDGHAALAHGAAAPVGLAGHPERRARPVPLSDSVKGGHEASQSGMGKFLTKHPEALRIMVGGASSGACGVEEFLRDDVSLFW